MKPRRLLAFFAAGAHCWFLVTLTSTRTLRSFSAQLLSTSWVPVDSGGLCRCRSPHFPIFNFLSLVFSESQTFYPKYCFSIAKILQDVHGSDSFKIKYVYCLMNKYPSLIQHLLPSHHLLFSLPLPPIKISPKVKYPKLNLTLPARSPVNYSCL